VFTVRVLVPLGVLPVLVTALIAGVVRPTGEKFAPVRLALVRAAVLVGAGAVIGVEALSAFHAVTLGAIVALWSVAAALALALALAVARARRGAAGGPPIRFAAGLRGGVAAGVRWVRDRWRGAGRLDRALAAGLVALVLLELLVALVAPPNNFDSQTYHLPKIEHWVAQRNLDFFATRIHRQVTIAPGAEYLLLHLRLLTGGDLLYNLVQWSAGVACVLFASRIAGQLGGGPRAQLLTGYLVGTAPLVVLESTSTQTDLVVAAWVLALATLVLDELDRRSRPLALVPIGLAAGLAALTKATGLLADGPLLLFWGLAQLRLVQLRLVRLRGRAGAPPRPEPRGPAPRGPAPHGRALRGLAAGLAGTAAASLFILALAGTVAGPYLARVTSTYGSPLGPAYLRDSISMQRHDPPAVLVNALRIGQTAVEVPVGAVNRTAAHGVEAVARLLHVDPNDPKITFWGSTFPVVSWPPNEDKASFPVQAVLVLLGAGYVLVRPGRATGPGSAQRGRSLAFAALFWATVLVYVTMLKWQPWGNRLLLFLFALGTPLAGRWLETVLLRAERAWTERVRAMSARAMRARAVRARAVAWVTVLTLAAGGVAGVAAVGYGWPRRLIGPSSIFTLDRTQARFVWRPSWQDDYEWAARAVRASGARRIGLAQGDNTWEYPWWVLLPGTDIEALQSVVPGHPAATPARMDAILCVVPAAVCNWYAPRGWRIHLRGQVGYVLPPDRDR
jgi:hypothetical protein